MNTDPEQISGAIRDDVAGEICRFVDSVRRTFALDAYPRIDDGEVFDRQLEQLKRDFERLERTFHDYLLAGWSSEASRSLEPPTSS